MYKANPMKYSAILMDIHMPEMNGYEAAREIRAIEAELENKNVNPRKRIPIIAMTANVFKEDVEKCLKAGMTSHIKKPVDYEELMRQLDMFITLP